MTRVPLALIAATLGLSTPARAQLCIGSTSFAHAPVQLTGAAAFSADGESFNAGVGAGGGGLFMQGIIGKTNYDEFNGSSDDLGVGAGYQFALDPKGTMHLCPLVSWQHGNGPQNVAIGSLIVDLSQTTWVFGLGLGGVALSGPTQIVPTGSIAMAKISVKASQGEFLPSSSSSDNFAVFEVGVGFIFSQSFALRPSALFTFGIENTTTTYGVSAALSIVRRRGSGAQR